MRAFVAATLSLGLLVGCVQQESTPTANPSSTPSLATTSQATIGVPCAPAIPALGSGVATLTLLPHAVGTQVIFGLDGSFVASAYGYPLGATWHWWELDRDGTSLSEFEWRQAGIVQSPDGNRLAYSGQDPASGKTGLFVREMLGPERFVAQTDGRAYAWLDAEHVLIDPLIESGAVRAIDIRTGADRIVFAPPQPPTPKAADSEYDYFGLTSDARWAIFTRSNASGVVLRQDLYDVGRQAYVSGVSLGPMTMWIAPVGDLVLWLDGVDLRAMHLCDHKVATIGQITPSPGGLRTFAWSQDGRFASFSFGDTSEETGPDRVVVLDVSRGAIAEIERPWGAIRQWSPDGHYVVLTRRGYHFAPSKLAAFELR